VAALLLLVASTVHAGPFQDTTSVAPTDSLVADSLLADTLKSTIIAGMGQLDTESDTSPFHYTNILWTDTRSLSDLLRPAPGLLLRELGRPGQPDQLVFGGIDGRGFSFLMDGRPLTNPVTGQINPYDIPIEFVERIELKTFTQSFAEGPDASTATVNIVSRQYNTGKPITKIRFMQGPYEHLLTDALFTQNVTRRVNVMIGVQRHVSDDRFLNSSYDSWNVRSRIRYNPSDHLNISLTDFYRKNRIGMNNGIDIDSTVSLGLDPFNEAEAVPYSELASESFTRRDVTLGAIFNAVDDSLSPTQVNAYYTTAERQYTDDTGLTSGAFDNYAFEIHGISFRQTLRAWIVRIVGGGQIERRIAGLGPVGVRDRMMSAVYGRASLDLGLIRPEAMVRAERNGDGQGLSWGIRGEVKAWDAMVLTAGWSDSRRFPTLQELNWPLYLFSSAHSLVEKHRVAHLSVRIQSGSFSLTADAARRNVEDALLFRTLAATQDFPPIVISGNRSLTVDQASGSLALTLGPWEAGGGFTWTEIKDNGVPSALHPRFMLNGELSYHDRFFDDALDARFVVRSRFVGEHTGTRFFPASGVFAENSGRTLDAFSTFDLHGVFHIGDAFVTITWENPLNREFFAVYPYPAMNRSVRVGLNWIFLD